MTPEGGAAAVRWARPGPHERTRYLFVGNAGEACGVSSEALTRQFDVALGGDGGVVAIHAPPPPPPKQSEGRSNLRRWKERSHVFAEFESEDAAARAIAALGNGVPCDLLGGRKLTLHFASRAAPKGPSPRGGDGASTSSSEAASCDASTLGVPGLSLVPDFVSEDEERRLLALLDDLDATGAWDALARRRVKHFGFAFDYGTRGVRGGHGPSKVPVAAMPPSFMALAQRVSAHCAPDPSAAFDQMTVNDYPPGVGLAPHVDTHSCFAGAIASVSLGSGCVMEFRRAGHAHRPLFLPPRSLLIMAGESRLAWQHYIPHRKRDLIRTASGPEAGEGADVLRRQRQRRVSLTLRCVRKEGRCGCAFPEACDDQGAALPPTRKAMQEAREGGTAEADPAPAPELERVVCSLSFSRLHTAWPHVSLLSLPLPPSLSFSLSLRPSVSYACADSLACPALPRPLPQCCACIGCVGFDACICICVCMCVCSMCMGCMIALQSTLAPRGIRCGRRSQASCTPSHRVASSRTSGAATASTLGRQRKGAA